MAASRSSTWLDRRLIIVLLLLLAIFLICLAAPQLILTPFLFAPVLVAVAFASPRQVAVIGAIAYVMALYAGYQGVTFTSGLVLWVRAPAMAA